MRLTVNQRDLGCAIEDASVATPKNHATISAVAKVLLRADEDGLTVTGCDGSGFFSIATCQAEVQEQGEVLVDPFLKHVVSKRSGNVKLRTKKGSLLVDGRKLKGNMSTADPQNFPIPRLEVGEDAESVLVPKDISQGVSLALDDSGPVHWFRSIHFVDGHIAALPRGAGRLTIARVLPFKGQYIIRDKHLTLARRVVDWAVPITLLSTTAVMDGDDRKIVIPLEAGASVPAEILEEWLSIPTVINWRPRVEYDLMTELDLCIRLSGDGHRTGFSAKDNVLTLSSDGVAAGSHTAEIDIISDGDFSFTANAEFWRDAVKHVAERIKVEMYEHGGVLHARIHNGDTFHFVSPQGKMGGK